MILFTAKDIKLMGDPHPTYGQSYFGSVHEQPHPVRFNKKEQIDFFEGMKFHAESSTEEKSKSTGKPYTQLKKVKIGEPEAEQLHDPWAGETKGERKPRPQPSDEPSYESGTNARWALKLSIDTFKSVLGRVPEDGTDQKMIHDFAIWLLNEFTVLKNHPGTQITASSDPQIPVSSEASQSEQSAGVHINDKDYDDLVEDY